MKPDKKNQKISRKEFLQIGGSVIAGGTILGLSGVTLWKNYKHKTNPISQSVAGLESVSEEFRSPYKLVSSFSIPDKLDSFELLGDRIVVSTANKVFIYSATGTLEHQFEIGQNLRDMAVANNEIYLLFPSRFEVYNAQGDLVRNWEAGNENADYCSMAVGGNAVFATDAANKNMCKYTTDGKLDRIVQSPNRFIIPSYSFGITYADGLVYCSNPGRHQVEKYTADGEYLGAFGQAGGAVGNFGGCCNPVHLSYTSTGEIITSEKGNPRISCYSKDGKFQNQLLDSKTLGGGHIAYRVKVAGDKLFVAGKNLVSTFQYDKSMAAKTACSTCGIDCPLREGTLI
ncbi:hypothetical protein [Mangrovibacterium marinum]|uniref:Uncharacterized protein n=1 Tax=Mangrovibacterium marinum TaxID=1639118 RepID=A0A2T5C0U5_9BACT|nr:hypothetical protein [Mangrovibacterium marinum]PTN08227.1 hypothetical protein C8N47_110113 [Mangrovibacterium marinum]